MATDHRTDEPESLEELLDRIDEATPDEGEVSLEAILDSVGRRSFGPLLLLAGLITLAPLVGDIPGVPTLMAIFVLLTAGQLLLRREHFWLPRWMLERSVKQENLDRALRWLRRPVHFVDRWIHPRLEVLVTGPGLLLVAGVCVAIALVMPLMEVVPFSANGAGAALTTFGLSLIAKDGLLALVALTVTLGTLGLVAYHLL